MTPLVGLDRLPGDSSCRILAKLEGHNPSGSAKDRIVRNMLQQAEDRGEISPGDTLVEATSGNTGIALAMAASRKGYRVILVVPDEISEEMRITMAAFGAELMPAPGPSVMERARDLAKELEQQGVGRVLDQFANEDNPAAHYQSTGPEIWKDSDGDRNPFHQLHGYDRNHRWGCQVPEGTEPGDSSYRGSADRRLSDCRHANLGHPSICPQSMTGPHRRCRRNFAGVGRRNCAQVDSGGRYLCWYFFGAAVAAALR